MLNRKNYEKIIKKTIAAFLTACLITAIPMEAFASNTQIDMLKKNVSEAKQNLDKANEVVEYVKSQVEDAKKAAAAITDETKATEAKEIVDAFKDTYEKALWVASVHETKYTDAVNTLKAAETGDLSSIKGNSGTQPSADNQVSASLGKEQKFSGMVLSSASKANVSALGKDAGSNATLGDAALLIFNQIANKTGARTSYFDLAEGSPYYNAVSLLGAYGYYPSNGNVASSSKNITRAELCYMLSPFFGAGTEPANYVDVLKGSAYYPYIAKATEYGWIDGFPDGTFRPNDNMTIAQVANAINRAVGFSGDDELDTFVANTLASITTPDMDPQTKLRACYNYTRDNFQYLKRNYYNIGDRGWNIQEGKVMFQTHRGNCYCFTSVFYYLAKRLGYNARSISGVVGRKRSPHGWVEIDEGGVTYIYDTELEMAYRKKGQTQYDFFRMPYSNVPWPYVKR